MSRRSIQKYFEQKRILPAKPRTAWQKLLIVLNAMPDLFLAGLFLVTWINPALTGGVNMVWGLMQLILLESIAPFAAAITIQALSKSSETKWERTKSLLYLSTIYASICATVSEFIGNFWPCIGLPWVIGNRLLAIWTGQQVSKEMEDSVSYQWLWGSACYLALMIFHTAFSLPRFGMTNAFIPPFIYTLYADLGFEPASSTTPWELLSFGFLYYLIQAVTELIQPKWLQK